jgi:hypothetical protein
MSSRRQEVVAFKTTPQGRFVWSKVREALPVFNTLPQSGPEGILPSGATYILAPKSANFQPYKRKPPYRSSDYASLSPVQFLSTHDLEAALKPLNDFRKWSEKEDNSAANKRYNSKNRRHIFLVLV